MVVPIMKRVNLHTSIIDIFDNSFLQLTLITHMADKNVSTLYVVQNVFIFVWKILYTEENLFTAIAIYTSSASFYPRMPGDQQRYIKTEKINRSTVCNRLGLIHICIESCFCCRRRDTLIKVIICVCVCVQYILVHQSIHIIALVFLDIREIWEQKGPDLGTVHN